MWLSLLLCLLASVAGGPSSTVSDASPKANIPDDRIQTFAQIWQKRLHLDEWTIETRVVRKSELKPETLGNLKWNLAKHTAVIRVLSPLDYDMPAADVPEDMEYTVVHEMIHLQLAVLPRDPNAKETEEQVVNRIADALMALDKGPTFHARSVPPQNAPKKVGAAGGEVAGRQAPQTPTVQNPERPVTEPK
jgi:hypothetical protein